MGLFMDDHADLPEHIGLEGLEIIHRDDLVKGGFGTRWMILLTVHAYAFDKCRMAERRFLTVSKDGERFPGANRKAVARKF